MDALSFPALGPTRAAVLDALVAVSAEPDALRRLGAPPVARDVVDAHVRLLDAPAAPVATLYSGVLFDALGLSTLDAASRRRARSWIVVISALWGALRVGDRVPPYRLNMCGRLPGLAHLPDVWREPLDDALPAAAPRGVVVDCRVAEYATAWRPSGALAARTVVVKVVRADDPTRGESSHASKRVRGLLVRQLVTDAIDPPGPEDLPAALAAHFDVDLRRTARHGGTWELRVVAPPP